VNAFYNNLSSLVRDVPNHNVLLVAEDFNAHLGKEQQNKFTVYQENN